MPLHFPDDIPFAALALELDGAGGLHFVSGPLIAFAEANGVDVASRTRTQPARSSANGTSYIARPGFTRIRLRKLVLERLRDAE